MDTATLNVLLVAAPDSAGQTGWPGTNGAHTAFETLSARTTLLARLKAPAPDLVLLDGALPDPGALEALELLNEHWPDTPTIVLVAPDQADLALAAIEAGAADYAFKVPEELARLDFKLEAVHVRRRAARSQARAARKRVEERLHALNAAGTAVQEARTPAEIYATVAGELKRIGLDIHILQLAHDGATLVPTYSSIGHEQAQAAREITHLGEGVLHIPLARVALATRVLGSQRAIFVAELDGLVAEFLALDTLTRARLHALLGYSEAILAPMLREGQVMGLLTVTGNGHLTAEDLPAITAFANQISIALANAELFAQAHRRAERLKVLNDVGRVLTSTLDPQELYALIHREAGRVLAADAFYVALYDEKAERLHFSYQYDYGTILPPESMPLGDGLASRAVRTGRPVITRDRDDPLGRTAVRIGDPSRPSISGLHVPMLYGTRVVGVVSAQTYHANAYGDEDVQVLSIIAGQAAVAIENARLYEETRRRAEEVSALLDVTQAISTSMDLDRRLHEIAQAAKVLVDADGCSLYLLRLEQGELRALVALESYADEVLASPIHVGEGITGYVAQTGVGELVNHLENDPRAVEIPGTPPAVECMIAVPLLVEARVTGVMTVRRDGAREFVPGDLRLLTSFANQAAIAIENARLFDETRRRAEEVTALLTTTEAVASTLDLDTLLKIVGHQALRLIDGDSCTLWRIELDRTTLTPLLALDPHAQTILGTRLKAGEGLPGLVARSGEGCIMNYTVPEAHAPGSALHAGPECVLGVPLRIKDQVIGVMTVRRFGPRPFVDDDLHLLSSFANQAAVAMENARLYEDARRQAEELSALYHIGVTLSQTLDLPVMLEQSLALVLTAAEQYFSNVYLLGPDNETLHVAAQVGAVRQAADLPGLVRMGESPIGQAALQNRVLVTTWPGRAAPGDNALASAGTSPAWSLVSVPLASKGQVLGVLNVGSPGAKAPDDGQMRLLKTIAHEIAVAIENARLYRTLKERAQTLQRAYDELAEADRLKDELVQNVSHELRTPLIFIKGYVDLLLIGELGALSQEQHEALQVVETKTDTLARLVDDIMTLQTIDAATLQVEPLSLCDLARRALSGVEAAAEKQGLRLKAEIPSETIVVYGDRNRLLQVFDNLLGNALKFNAHGGSIIVRVSDAGERARAEVADTGIGIASDKLPHIFERFYQVDGSTTRRYGGAGLGLTITRQILAAHGTEIHVESDVGHGSRFWFTLPKVT